MFFELLNVSSNIEISKSLRKGDEGKIEGKSLTVKRVPYTKPKANQRTTMKFFNNGMVKIKVTKHNFQYLSHIRRFRRIDKNTVLDMTTGELIESKANSNGIRNKSSVYKSLYESNELILNNFMGEENEIIIIIYYDKPFQEIENTYKDFKSFREKLERRIGNIAFVAVKQFTNDNHLYYEVWLKKVDCSELNLDIKMLSKIWIHGNVAIEKIDNISEQSNYVENGQAVSNFPANQRVFSYSAKTIEKPRKYVTYNADAQRILQQENLKKVSSVTDSFLNPYNIEVQRIIYETYVLGGGKEDMRIDFSQVPPKVATAILEDTMKLLQETYSQVQYSNTDKQIISNTFKLAFTHIKNLESYKNNNSKGEIKNGK